MRQSNQMTHKRIQPWELKPISGFKKIFVFLGGFLAVVLTFIAGLGFFYPILLVYIGDLPLNTFRNISIFIGAELVCIMLMFFGGRSFIILNKKTEDEAYRQGASIVVVSGSLYRSFKGNARIRYSERTLYITALLGPTFQSSLLPLLLRHLIGLRWFRSHAGVSQEVPVAAENIEWVKGNGPRLTIKLFHAPMPGLDRMMIFLPVKVAVRFLKNFQKHLPGHLPTSYQQALSEIKETSEYNES